MATRSDSQNNMLAEKHSEVAVYYRKMGYISSKKLLVLLYICLLEGSGLSGYHLPQKMFHVAVTLAGAGSTPSSLLIRAHMRPVPLTGWQCPQERPRPVRGRRPKMRARVRI